MGMHMLGGHQLSESIITEEEMRKVLIEYSVDELKEFFQRNKFDEFGHIDYGVYVDYTIADLYYELSDGEFKQVLSKFVRAAGISDLESLLKMHFGRWSELNEEAKTWKAPLFLFIITAGNCKDEFISDSDKTFIREVCKHAIIYRKGERKAKKEIRQALLGHDSVRLEEAYEKLYESREIYNRYVLLCDVVNELFNELQPDEYIKCLNTISWWEIGKKVQYGLSDDRRLFSCVKPVIDEWDPEELLCFGAPGDEYDSEIGAVALLLKTAKDLDALALGVYGVLYEWYSYEKRSKPLFPEYTMIAGKLVTALKEIGLPNISLPDEVSYTLKELETLEAKLETLEKEMVQAFLEFEPEALNGYLDQLYEKLKCEYAYLSNHDYDSLFEYCNYRAYRAARRKCRFEEENKYIKKLSKLCGFKSSRTKLRFEFPEDLWPIYDTWADLTDENKLEFGSLINVENAFGLDAFEELVELQKKVRVM